MKYAFLIAISILCNMPTASAQKTVGLQELTKIISERNYSILGEAEKAYQAKLNIDQARANLLPKLNIWSLAKVLIDPIALLDIIPDVAPFLVPGNWFRLQENELLYYAEKEAYRALWANELNTTRTLYFKILMDRNLHQIVLQHFNDLKKLYEIAKARQLVGLEKVETVNILQMQLLKLEEDYVQLELLLKEEVNALSYSLGLAAEELIDIEAIHLDRPDLAKPLDYKLYVFRVLDSSPEARQYDNLLKVIPLLKQEVRYNFLGASETSRGVAGGVFDGISIGNGLGFANATSIDLISSQEKTLQIQQTGIKETLKRQLSNLVNTYNAIVQFYSKTEQRENLALSNIEILNFKLAVGEKLDILSLADAFEVRTLSRAAKNEQLYRFRLSQDRLQRLLFEGEFSKLPATLEELEK